MQYTGGERTSEQNVAISAAGLGYHALGPAVHFLVQTNSYKVQTEKDPSLVSHVTGAPRRRWCAIIVAMQWPVDGTAHLDIRLITLGVLLQHFN